MKSVPLYIKRWECVCRGFYPMCWKSKDVNCACKVWSIQPFKPFKFFRAQWSELRKCILEHFTENAIKKTRRIIPEIIKGDIILKIMLFCCRKNKVWPKPSDTEFFYPMELNPQSCTPWLYYYQTRTQAGFEVCATFSHLLKYTIYVHLI